MYTSNGCHSCTSHIHSDAPNVMWFSCMHLHVDMLDIKKNLKNKIGDV